MVCLGLFLGWRIRHKNEDAIWLWGISIVCEFWFTFSWLLDQLPKLCPLDRATDLVVLKEKFETATFNNPTGKSDLPGIDVFVSTSNTKKKPSFVIANTILSILAADYPVEKLSCYVSDDGGSLLTFENPESYFNLKKYSYKNRVHTDFVNDRRRVREEIKTMKQRIEVAGDDPVESISKATWMANGTHWPGTWINPSSEHTEDDHAGVIQLSSSKVGLLPIILPLSMVVSLIKLKPPSDEPLFGNNEEDTPLDFTNIDIRLPMLVYVSRQKHPDYHHNEKAGAMNALVRASAIMSNGPFILNLDYGHCQGVDSMGGMLGYALQSRLRKPLLSHSIRGDKFGNSSFLIASIPVVELQGRLADHPAVKYGRQPGILTSAPRELVDASTIAEALSVISCWYEDETEWGQRVGWIYGSMIEDTVTGCRMHNRGWKSVYCVTKPDAFGAIAPRNLAERLHQVFRWATGSVEIFFSRNNALLASSRMKILRRVAYLNVGIYPFTSIFLVVYCFLPALSLLIGQFIVQTLNVTFLMYLLLITLTLCTLSIFETMWSAQRDGSSSWMLTLCSKIAHRCLTVVAALPDWMSAGGPPSFYALGYRSVVHGFRLPFEYTLFFTYKRFYAV
ncbi:hypothetical protein ZIOFF_071702 [Zingiber officinale]|uniref:Uncharacterized protein n=1 Tax=Zingiber officinale TaxID=94328 RepID=A0A8J5ENV0_ZINOF|nr:hypothetical protein ZIOFF_071702 [Zingiber officinale]